VDAACSQPRIPRAADFTSAVTPFGGKVIETGLDEKDIMTLSKGLKKSS